MDQSNWLGEQFGLLREFLHTDFRRTLLLCSLGMLAAAVLGGAMAAMAPEVVASMLNSFMEQVQEAGVIDESGNIYIDGELLEESYGREVIQNPGRASDPVRLGEDEYFVMGDNRNNSSDSRDPSVGNIHRRDIIGRAFIRIWPFSKFGILKHQ